MTKLSVNINKIATLRNARGGNNPNIITVALDCERFGAQGITVHPRPDERHIRYQDVRHIKPELSTEFNIEGFPSADFCELVTEVKLEYQPWKGEIERRTNGSLIAMEAGTAYAYAIDKLQDRGRFFIFPQEDVYAGQVVGESAKDKDIVINVTKSKKLTNMRASGADEKAKIVPPVVFSLEEALEYIKEDEYVEVTPHHLRLRKIILDELERKRANKS